MHSETILPMPKSLASFIMVEKERYKKIQRLKEERAFLFKLIRNRFTPEGRERMKQCREEARRISILDHAVFGYGWMVKLELMSLEEATFILNYISKELEKEVQ